MTARDAPDEDEDVEAAIRGVCPDPEVVADAPITAGLSAAIPLACSTVSGCSLVPPSGVGMISRGIVWCLTLKRKYFRHF